jgi:hypothetical protein
MVRSELTRDPQITNDVLLKKAKAIDPSVRRLSPRQFHATYRLPVVRGTKTAAKLPSKTAAKPAPPPPKPASPAPASAPAAPATPLPTPASAASAAPATPATASHPASHQASHPAPTHRSTSTAVGRPNAAEREAVRQILQLVAREALATEDRGSFIRLLDSLDERAAVILGIFGRT